MVFWPIARFPRLFQKIHKLPGVVWSPRCDGFRYYSLCSLVILLSNRHRPTFLACGIHNYYRRTFTPFAEFCSIFTTPRLASYFFINSQSSDISFYGCGEQNHLPDAFVPSDGSAVIHPSTIFHYSRSFCVATDAARQCISDSRADIVFATCIIRRTAVPCTKVASNKIVNRCYLKNRPRCRGRFQKLTILISQTTDE